MKIQDEYKCRRCGKVFGEAAGDPSCETLAEWMAWRLENLEGENLYPLVHECAFGGVGIGDWIGASEAKEASNASDSSD